MRLKPRVSLFRTVVISVRVVSMGMNKMIGRVALLNLKMRIARKASRVHGVGIVRGTFIERRRRANEAAPNRDRRLIGERAGGPSGERCCSRGWPAMRRPAVEKDTLVHVPSWFSTNPDAAVESPNYVRSLPRRWRCRNWTGDDFGSGQAGFAGHS